MKKRVIAAIFLTAYSAVLVRIIVFKELPIIMIGSLIFKFGGTHEGATNLIPFRSILPYLLLKRGLMMAIVNLGGNIILFVPIGFLVPYVFPKMTWKKALALAIATGVAMEGMQELLHVGIVDIDDVILNALGVMSGYWLFLWVTAVIRKKRKTQRHPVDI